MQIQMRQARMTAMQKNNEAGLAYNVPKSITAMKEDSTELKTPMNQDFMEQDHVALAEVFRNLDAALAAGDAASSFRLLDFVWARLAVHIRAEHLRLFPALLNALGKAPATNSSSSPSLAEAHACFEILRHDHDFFMRELAGAVNTLRELSSDESGGAGSAERLSDVRGKISEVMNRLAEHNRLEEEQVYLWPEALLDEAAREELSAQMRLEIENLPPRFNEPVSGSADSEGNSKGAQ
jgi:hypothetical protein